MKYLRKSCFVYLFVALLALMSISAAGVASVKGASAQTKHALQCGGWSIVPSPNPFTGYNYLNAVAALSANDAWAVGYGANQNGSAAPFSEQWNGTSWQVVPSPTGGGQLYGIAALAANNIWAVGTTGNATSIEQWNGKRWQIITSPSPGKFSNFLGSVAALSPSDIWAIGSSWQGKRAHYRTLIEHWNGSAWSVVHSPNVASADNYLQGVTAISSANVWVVGSYNNRKQQTGAQTLSEHWDGSKWSIVQSPHPGVSAFNDATAIDASHIWTVGSSSTNGTFIVHWDVKRNHWRIRPSPSPGKNAALLAVSASSTNNIWTVGQYTNSKQLSATLTEHWDGSAWTYVPSANVASQNNNLNGVSIVAPNNVWAVGYSSPNGNATSSTLIEYYC